MANYYKRMQPLLGTFVEVGVSSGYNESVVTAAFEEIKQVHDKLSFHSQDSELNLLNNSNGKEVKLSAVTIKAIRLAKAVSESSGHRFNCTVGNHFKVLDATTLLVQNSARSGTSDNIAINGRKIKLTQGITLILDGIAKGLAVDLAIASLMKNGVTEGWVNAGGDLKVFGNQSWPIQVTTACGKSRQVLLKNMAIATSSYSEVDDIRYPATIISTNLHVSPSLGTWSVISKSAWRADALTKIAANSSSADRADIIKRLGGVLVDMNMDLV